MPGGKMTPHSPELLAKAKTEYLAGKPWKDVAATTGIDAQVLRQLASTHNWTTVRAQAKAKQELDGLRPELHTKLVGIVKSKPLSKPPTNMRGAQSQADLLLTLTNAAEKVEGWSPTGSQPLVNVQVLSESIIVPCLPSPLGPPAIDIGDVQD